MMVAIAWHIMMLSLSEFWKYQLFVFLHDVGDEAYSWRGATAQPLHYIVAQLV